MRATIRPMTPEDVGPAAEVVLRGEWGDRRRFFAWAVEEPLARPVVAVADGAVVGTAVGSVHGPVGWVGAIFVDAAARGRGLGRALTDEVVRSLEVAACETLVLVATEAGRPIYERMGFRLDTMYHTLEAPGTAGKSGAGGPGAGGAGRGPGPDLPPDRPPLERWRPADLAAMIRLDADATGEDRSHLLRAFASPETARVLRGPDGSLRGFLVRAPWGGGATIAAGPDDGVAILEARRAVAGADRRVRAGILEPNLAALDRLAPLGWSPAWKAPRLIRGEPLRWQPHAIWGQFNHALG